MSNTPVTVQVGGFEVTSSHESAEEMVAALTPASKDESKQPKVVSPEPDKDEGEKIDASTAAAVLGKKGGEAAAKARQIKPIPDKKAATSGDDGRGEHDSSATGALDQEPAGSRAVEAGADRAAGDLDPDFDVTGIEKGDIRARIQRAAAKAAEERRARAEAEDRLRMAEARVAQREAELERLRVPRDQAGAAAAEQETLDRFPYKWEDFETPEEYTAAYYQWARGRELAQEQQQRQIEAIAERVDQTFRAYNKRVWDKLGVESEAEVQAAIGKLSPDVQNLKQSWYLGPTERASARTVMADEIAESEMPYELMTFLSEHPEEFQRIASLPSVQKVQREMAKLEARVEAAASGTPALSRTSSKAHPPVRPVTGAPVPADLEEPSDELPFKEWVKRRQAQEQRKAHQR